MAGQARGSEGHGERGERSDEVIAFALMTVGNDWCDNPSRLLLLVLHVQLQQLAFVSFHE